MARPPRSPDLKVIFRLTATTRKGDIKRVLSGYRPIYGIRTNYWSSAHHEFVGQSGLATGENCLADVWLLSPEAYPGTMWVGRLVSVAEGAQLIGQAQVLQVVNPLLLATAKRRRILSIQNRILSIWLQLGGRYLLRRRTPRSWR